MPAASTRAWGAGGMGLASLFMRSSATSRTLRPVVMGAGLARSSQVTSDMGAPKLVVAPWQLPQRLDSRAEISQGRPPPVPVLAVPEPASAPDAPGAPGLPPSGGLSTPPASIPGVTIGAAHWQALQVPAAVHTALPAAAPHEHTLVAPAVQPGAPAGSFV